MKNAKAQAKLSAAREARDAVAETRDDLLAAKSHRARLASAPVPMVEAVAALDLGLDALVADCASAVPLANLVMPARQSQLVVYDHPKAAIAIAAAAGAAQLRSTIIGRLEEFYRDKAPLTREAREAAVTRADAEILALELAEETLIRRAEADGLRILRRHDADPEAVLATLDA